MGYTHYWYKKPVLSQAAWDAFLLDVDKLVRNSGAAVQYESDIVKPPLVGHDEVRFNGVGGDGHETFLFDRIAEDAREEDGRVFDFCKTAHKPYDVLVTAILVAAKKHFGDDIRVASDGDDGDWEEGFELAARLLGYTAKHVGAGDARDLEVS